MKNEKLINAIGDIDDDIIDAACREKAANKKNIFLKWGAAAAGLLIIASAVGIPMLRNGSRSVDTDGTQKGTQNVTDLSEDMDGKPAKDDRRWDKMTDPERYVTVEYNGLVYTTRLIAVHTENVGEKLDEAPAYGFDIYDKEERTTNGTVYSIRGISADVALAFRFNENDEYSYAYLNPEYKPETLGDFINDLNLKEYLSIGTVDRIDGEVFTHYEDILPETVWKMLLDDGTVRRGRTDYAEKITMSISASVDVLGYHYTNIILSDDGYLYTDILAKGLVFNIGKEKVDLFVSEITNNYQGIEDVPCTMELTLDE